MNILYKFILLDGGESSDGNAPVNTVAPEISGTIGVGEIFTSTTGTWTSDSAITYSYQWYRNGIAIVGAINNTYEIQTADIDNYISCGVNACDTDGCDEAGSNQTLIVTEPINTVLPSISGTLIVGQDLTSTTGTWTGLGTITYSYQWKRGGVNIGGATSSTYTLLSDDAGVTITCEVTANNMEYQTSATSTGSVILATILDLVPNALGAYGFELLRGAFYSSALIRIRRSGDNAESDFSCGTDGNLNITSIQAFCIAGGGAQDGLVVKMYNQSGNANASDQTQATPLSQPRIVVAGVIVTENSKISALYNGTSQRMNATLSATISQPVTQVAIAKVTSTNGGIVGSATYATDLALCKVGATTRALATASTLSYAGSTTNLAYYFALFNGASSQVKLNNNATATGNLGAVQLNQISIGYNSNYGYMAGRTSRVIVYNSNQSANEATLRTNLNSVYGVY